MYWWCKHDAFSRMYHAPQSYPCFTVHSLAEQCLVFTSEQASCVYSKGFRIQCFLANNQNIIHRKLADLKHQSNRSRMKQSARAIRNPSDQIVKKQIWYLDAAVSPKKRYSLNATGQETDKASQGSIYSSVSHGLLG